VYTQNRQECLNTQKPPFILLDGFIQQIKVIVAGGIDVHYERP
jgi:hypothetical protein